MLISLSQATFVGNIVDVVLSGETTRTIRIEDGTGTITSTHTIKREEEVENPPKWRWLFPIHRKPVGLLC